VRFDGLTTLTIAAIAKENAEKAMPIPEIIPAKRYNNEAEPTTDIPYKPHAYINAPKIMTRVDPYLSAKPPAMGNAKPQNKF